MCFDPIRLQDSSIINISEISIMEIVTKEEQYLGLPLLVGCCWV